MKNIYVTSRMASDPCSVLCTLHPDACTLDIIQRHECNRRYCTDSYPPQIVLTADQDDGSVGAELEDLLVPECSAVLQRLQPRDVVAEQDHVAPADIMTILHTKCSFHFSYFS